MQKNDTYANISSPIKAKETLGYGTPIIVSDNLAVAEDVKKGDYGWIVEPEPSAIKELLEYLSNHPKEINQKTQNAIRAAKYNTWKARAEQIIEDCKKIEANKNPKL